MIIDFSPTPVFYIIIGLLVGMFVGWVGGFFDANNRTAQKIKTAETNAEIKMQEAELKLKQAGEQLAHGSPSSESVQDDPGLLRIKNRDGRIMLEMDGAPVTGTLSPEKKKRLIELITFFRPWLEGGGTSPQLPQTPPMPAPAVQEPASRPLQPVKKPEAEKNIRSLSIVQQIDTVLQARLMDTSLDKRGIRLQESPEGAVEVYVGLQKFHSVDDVPDEVIKAVIRGAISEWEDKYTPRL
ncbi:MAG: hypothetical protein QY332_02120 [Anaerolineales bacterium]|nr:MAG: hypothetical protein QY332_02120 [Anaerolineales bacterium]